MARPADLLAHVAADLTGCEVVRGDRGSAVVTPADGRPAFRLEVRSERRRLLHLQTLLVHVDGPHVAATEVSAADVAGAATLVFHHTGQLRRTGLTATIRSAGRGRRWSGVVPPAVAAVRDRLLADGALEAASLTLDFTRFEVAVVDGRWRATLELMGASHVRTTLPPSARYVRLHPDQRDALLATVAVLHARLPGTAPRPVAAPTGSRVPSSRPDHLPRRPV
jgi:hypothetical protein